MIATPFEKLSPAASITPPGGDDCSDCGCKLSIHQPDTELPDRLIGTCRECKAWYLLDGDMKIVRTIQI